MIIKSAKKIRPLLYTNVKMVLHRKSQWYKRYQYPYLRPLSYSKRPSHYFKFWISMGPFIGIIHKVIYWIMLSVRAAFASPVSYSWLHSMENGVWIMEPFGYCNQKSLISIRGRSRGLVVKADSSWPRGHGFKPSNCILDRHKWWSIC